MERFPTQADIDEMRARGFISGAIEAACDRMERGKMAESICERIREAFAGVTLGNGVGLQQAQGLDDRENDEICARWRFHDEKENWATISSERLNACFSSPSFFDAEGMRFHLPAYLIADLRGEYKFEMAANLTLLSDYSERQFRLLSTAQRDAVRKYLRFTSEEQGYFLRSDIDEALSGFWSEDRD